MFTGGATAETSETSETSKTRNLRNLPNLPNLPNLEVGVDRAPQMAPRLDPAGEPGHTLANEKGTVMNRWIGPLLALFAACALAVPAVAQTAIKPAIVYSTGGKFDKSFNEGVSMGAEKFKKETSIVIAEFEPTNETQFEQAQR